MTFWSRSRAGRRRWGGIGRGRGAGFGPLLRLRVGCWLGLGVLVHRFDERLLSLFHVRGSAGLCGRPLASRNRDQRTDQGGEARVRRDPSVPPRGRHAAGGSLFVGVHDRGYTPEVSAVTCWDEPGTSFTRIVSRAFASITNDRHRGFLRRDARSLRDGDRWRRAASAGASR